MSLAIASLLMVLLFSLLVTRLAAIALTLTGMSYESARFQARSALAGVGFTTKESEAVVNHPVRRRIIGVLILIGSVGIPTVIATTVVSVLTGFSTDGWFWQVLLFGAGIMALLSFGRSRWVEMHLNRIFSWGLKKWTTLDVRDYVSLLQLQNGYAVTEMIVDPGDWVENKTLLNAELSQEGILVLGIKQSDGNYLGTPRATNVIKAGDTLILYGLIDHLNELDERDGKTGEQAHKKAVEEYRTQSEN
jgi:MFS family permease